MKVMCIDGEWKGTAIGKPAFGVIYTVIDSVKSQGIVWYELAEFPPDRRGRRDHYESKAFIPLSDIDETELVKERENYFVTTDK